MFTETLVVHSPLTAKLPEPATGARKRLIQIAPYLAGLRDDIPLGTTINPFREGLDLLVSSLATENVELNCKATRRLLIEGSVNTWIDCDARKRKGVTPGMCKELKKVWTRELGFLSLHFLQLGKQS